MSRKYSNGIRFTMQLFWIMAGEALCLTGARRAYSQTSANSLYNFMPGYTTGSRPSGTLPQDSHGFLYGSTSYRDAPLFQGANKVVYGTMHHGGFLGQGAAFRCITPSTTSGILAILHNFGINSPEGYNPQGIYYQDRSGYLYGICPYGGTSGGGSLWKMKVDGSGFTVLHGFGSGLDGYAPYIMVSAPGRILYGVCNYGGQNGNGTFWSYNTASNALKVLNSFTFSNWFTPTRLLLEPDGNIFGFLIFGGRIGYRTGQIFDISTTFPYTITMLYSLDGGCERYFNSTAPHSRFFHLGTLLSENDPLLPNASDVTGAFVITSVINVTSKRAIVTIKTIGNGIVLGPIQLVVTWTSNPTGLMVTNADGIAPEGTSAEGSPYLTIHGKLPHSLLSLAPGMTAKVTVDLSGAVTSSTTLSIQVFTGRIQ